MFYYKLRAEYFCIKTLKFYPGSKWTRTEIQVRIKLQKMATVVSDFTQFLLYVRGFSCLLEIAVSSFASFVSEVCEFHSFSRFTRKLMKLHSESLWLIYMSAQVAANQSLGKSLATGVYLFNWEILKYTVARIIVIFFFKFVVLVISISLLSRKKLLCQIMHFFTLLHKWVDKWQMHHFEKLQ